LALKTVKWHYPNKKYFREALTQLRELGIDPYPANEFVTTAYSSEILADFDKYDGKEVILAGRLMGKRIMGKGFVCGIERR
jgi:lysyl-tRNA synthetase class II